MPQTRRLYSRPDKWIDVAIDEQADEIRWGVYEQIDTALIERNKARSNHGPKRAPLGDAHGAWMKVCEVPVSVLLEKLPIDAWEDEKALARFLNDPDNRAWRTDGARTY